VIRHQSVNTDLPIIRAEPNFFEDGVNSCVGKRSAARGRTNGNEDESRASTDFYYALCRTRALEVFLHYATSYIYVFYQQPI
jgi:hypothetical protein